MRSLILSDVHSNHEALSSILNFVKRKRIDRVICLGDFVGYGAEPNQVLDRMRTLRPARWFVRGNHDRVAAGFDEGETFNLVARSAALWTRGRLSAVNRRFVAHLPQGPLVDRDGTVICHGSPLDEDQYLFGLRDAAEVFQSIDAPLVFFGHTHLPVIFSLTPERLIDGEPVRTTKTIPLDRRNRYLLNPGSVGQPRDRNKLAAACIFDHDTYVARFIRVPYDIESARKKILRAGLPKVLGDRLLVGS